MDLVSKNHYQIACQRYWEALHGVPIDDGINHPNQFFEESQKFLNGGVLPSQGKASCSSLSDKFVFLFTVKLIHVV